MRRGTLLALLLLALLVGGVDAHKRWWRHWKHYKDKAERWQRHLQDSVKEWGEQLPQFEGLDWGKMCGDRCEEQTAPLVGKVEKLERRLRRCGEDRRQLDLALRERDALDAKLATCQHQLREAGGLGAAAAALRRRLQRCEALAAEEPECPLPREPSCPEPPEPPEQPEQPEQLERPCPDAPTPTCEACRPRAAAAAAAGDAPTMHLQHEGSRDFRLTRHMPGLTLLSVLLAVLAVRLWLRVQQQAKRVKALEPALDAARQQVAALQQELRGELPAPAPEAEEASEAPRDFPCSVEEDTAGDGIVTRRIRITCPGVSHGQIRVEGGLHQCTVTIERPCREGVPVEPWQKIFRFRASEGSFEFQEELAELERGILTLAFARAPKPSWVFRFPQHFDLAEADREMAWMLASDSALPLDAPGAMVEGSQEEVAGPLCEVHEGAPDGEPLHLPRGLEAEAGDAQGRAELVLLGDEAEADHGAEEEAEVVEASQHEEPQELPQEAGGDLGNLGGAGSPPEPPTEAAEAAEEAAEAAEEAAAAAESDCCSDDFEKL